MSQPVVITTAQDRGAGLIYVGSVWSQHGQTVRSMYDCYCGHCVQFDVLDDRRRVEVVLTNGQRLLHARMTSFRRVEDLYPDAPQS